MQKKLDYEQFTKLAIDSDYFSQLARNNKWYRHVFRFVSHIILFFIFIWIAKYSFALNYVLGIFVFGFYLYFQGLLISGFMIHSHELSHNQIKIRWLNNSIGIISGFISFINFYSFQNAHRFHHKNIGNMDAPEAGAPVSLTGQRTIRHDDNMRKKMEEIFYFSKFIWFLVSWPLFIYYGDYNSWLLPFWSKGRMNRASFLCFLVFMTVNCILLVMFSFDYIIFYILPMLLGGNRILAITFMHHAHEDSVFFSKEHHNFYNTIMSTTDRDFGKIVNYFMMNNGYHIPHHMNPHIAYYDLEKASAFLRKIIPEGLSYNFYPKSRFYHDLLSGTYDQRLVGDYAFYQPVFAPIPKQRKLGQPLQQS